MDNADALRKLCQEITPATGLSAFEAGLNNLLPGHEFRHVLTRGHWHRLGGVVDAQHCRISDNIAHWAEAEADGEVDNLLVKYADAGYIATRLAGRTHYLTAPVGDKAQDFVQVEIEELQEVLERPLIARDWFPDSLEEFLEPLGVTPLTPQPVAPAYYQFRRITPIAELLEGQRDNRNLAGLRRFLGDWHASSAHKAAPFCRHWVLELREYLHSDGECRLNAKPVSTYAGELPAIPVAEDLHGAQLANAIQDYDQRLGYPFAWYFILLTRKAANYSLVEAVLRDQAGAYDYLPLKNLQVLQAWEQRQYGV